MKVGILAGGRGTRIASESDLRPKPMVEIGGSPLLWHIMAHYAHYGHSDFTIAGGYKVEIIDQWLESADIAWNVELIDTGPETGTGGRIKRLQKYLGPGTCMVTWGDGLANIDLDELLAFHRSHGKLATLTAVQPPPRFGHLDLDGDAVRTFAEKPTNAEGWVNGAFFILEPAVFDYIADDSTMFEQEPLGRLADEGQLMAYRHTGFWQCMDNLGDKRRLEELWDSGAPWCDWKTATTS